MNCVLAAQSVAQILEKIPESNVKDLTYYLPAAKKLHSHQLS